MTKVDPDKAARLAGPAFASKTAIKTAEPAEPRRLIPTAMDMLP